MRKKEAQEVTDELANDSEIVEELGSKRMVENPMAQCIIEVVEKSYDVTLEDAEALLQVIKENRRPVRLDSSFGADKQGNQ